MDPSDLLDAPEKEENVVPQDTRQLFGFEKEYITGAINIPRRSMDEESTKLSDRTKTYICYCNGIG